MIIVPTAAVPSQTLSVTLGGQYCDISLYTKKTNLFLDLSVATVTIMTTAICRDRVRLVRQSYLGFLGDLSFFDLQSTDDPYYELLGTRFVLAYLSTDEL